MDVVIKLYGQLKCQNYLRRVTDIQKGENQTAYLKAKSKTTLDSKINDNAVEISWQQCHKFIIIVYI